VKYIDSCRQYYECENGETLSTCPEDTPFFDYRAMTCKSADADPAPICYPLSSKDDLETPSTPSPEPTLEPTTPTEETTTEETTTEETTTEDPIGETTTSDPLPQINTCEPNYDYTDYLPHPSNQLNILTSIWKNSLYL